MSGVGAGYHAEDDGLVDRRAHGDEVVPRSEDQVLQVGLADGGAVDGEGEGEVALYEILSIQIDC